MRELPGTNQTAITKIEPGNRLRVEDKQNGWIQVITENEEIGWLPLWLIDQKEFSENDLIAAQTISETSLFDENNIGSLILEIIPEGDYLLVNEEIDGWSQVEYKGKLGYVPTEDLRFLQRHQLPPEIIDQQSADLIEPVEDETVLENPVIMRQANQAVLNAPDVYSDVLYVPEMYEEFEFISSIENEQGEFYLVVNDLGQRGYVEARTVSFANDSDQHVGRTDANSMQEATIIIDAGHGGLDPGAISQDEQTYEKQLTLSTSYFLKEYLEEMGATVILVREQDDYVELEDRAQFSNDNQADVFVSIHYDAGYDPESSGTTTYYYHPNDIDLANSINLHLERTPLDNLGVLFGNYLVLRENHRPSALLELGYMSNSHDLYYIRQEEYQRQVARAIAEGIKDYIEMPMTNVANNHE